MKVYNLGAQVERHIGVIKVTDGDTFSTALHTLACIWPIRGRVIHPTSFYWTNNLVFFGGGTKLGRSLPISFCLLLFKKRFATESAE
jgi:hypothetical protein